MPVAEIEQSSTYAGPGLAVADMVPTMTPPTAPGVLAIAHERLGRREIRRRFWHMAPGLLPVLLWGVPHADPISGTLRSILLGLIVAIGCAILWKYRRIARQADGEFDRLSCVAGYAGSLLISLFLFPSAVEIAFATLAILAFGDGSATIGGKVIGGPTLPWNRKKTWSGLLSFVAVGIPVAAVFYWRESQNLEAVTPGVSYFTAVLCCSVAVLIAAIAESVRSRLNDNVRVGIAALAVMPIMHGLLVGWD